MRSGHTTHANTHMGCDEIFQRQSGKTEIAERRRNGILQGWGASAQGQEEDRSHQARDGDQATYIRDKMYSQRDVK